jgi:hypothetical protein
VYKQGIQQIGNLLLVGKVQSSLEGDPEAMSVNLSTAIVRDLPDSLQVHGANLDHVTRLLRLKNTIAAPSRHASDV